MRRLLLAVALVGAAFVVHPAAVAQDSKPVPGVYETSAPASPRNRIDELVFARWRTSGTQSPRLCSDAVFVRRAFLDVSGALPTADEARRFIEDRDPDKRSKLVDGLLERDEYADYWAMKWSDVLRVKSEFPINLWPNAVQAYHKWIRDNISKNLPYDEFARQLLTASGSNFRVPPVNFYRAVRGKDPQTLATAVALTFMGARADRWPRERLQNMAAFFSQLSYKGTAEWKEEIVFFDSDKPAPAAPTLPDGTRVQLKAGSDPREAFAGWLITPQNPWFSAAVVNRIWFWLLGRGIVHEPDDIRPDNPPSNQALLDYLSKELVRSRYDLKHIYRLILNSSTYQLSSIGGDEERAQSTFDHALVWPLDAEVLVDAINKITGSSEQYSSAIPEPFTFIPPGRRSTALADASISSTFLEAFGRSPRDSGLALERANRPTAAQRLYLLNSTDVQRKLQQGTGLQTLVGGSGDAGEATTNLYLAILSRFPTGEELRIATGYFQAAGNRRMAAIDVAWALMNSAEFRYRH